MTRSLTFAYPGDLGLNTGGYGYDRRMIAGLRDLGWTVTPLSLGPGFPAPSDAQRTEAERRLSALPNGARVVVDGLAYGVLDAWAAREGARLNIVALVHHPLALETGIGAEAQAHLRASETRALAQARQVIVTSPMTARELAAHYNVPPARITTVLPGTDPAPLAPGGGEPPHILSIGTLTPRKGHDVLIEALHRIRDLPWRATIAGSKTLAPATAAALADQCAALGLADRLTLAGECDDPRALMATADLFALASRYEGYGMVFAEALSQGLPIVACHAGAVPEVVPDNAGILVPVDDAPAFATALRDLLSDPARRAEKAEGARRAGAELPRWQDGAARISKLLETCLERI